MAENIIPECAYSCTLEEKVDKIVITLDSVKEELENVPILNSGGSNIVFKRKEFDQLIYNKLSPSFALSKFYKSIIGFATFLFVILQIVVAFKILGK